MRVLILFCFVYMGELLFAQPGVDMQLLKERYVQSVAGHEAGKEWLVGYLKKVPMEKEVSDQNVIELQQQYPLLASQVTMWIETLQLDGAWPDINYQDRKRSGWEPKIHAERIWQLARYYAEKKAKGTEDEIKSVEDALHRAMNFWFQQKLVCDNWWYNQIGIPRTLGPAFLIFEPVMTTDERQAAVEVMKKARFGMTGQNKVWLAGNVLIRGLLENDWTLVKAARDTIVSEIVLGRVEGIKEDWCFHQHGPQQQFGNYGLSFLWNMSFYSALFSDTSLALSVSQQQILHSLLLDGYQWIVWKGHFDVNALNRQLFRNADVDKAFCLIFAAHSLRADSDMEKEQEISRLINWNLNEKREENTFVGNKYFYTSDYTIHRTKKWMASVRMASNRIIGTELVNEDNLKGYYMADGALYTYVRGDEYHDIFPFWNWRRIPGTTTFDNEAMIPNPNECDSRNHSSYVGGVSWEGTGITSMQLNRNKLRANKSWIFTDDYVLCMGSNIHSDSISEIQTSIDQRFSVEPFWSYKNERFFHDNTGYIVLKADTCIATNEVKKGQWKDFMGMYKPEILSSNIFSIYLKHRTDLPASYLYLVLPAKSLQEVADFDYSGIQVVRNDDTMQAVIINKLCYVSTYTTDMSLDVKGKQVFFSAPGSYLVGVESGTIVVGRPF